MFDYQKNCIDKKCEHFHWRSVTGAQHHWGVKLPPDFRFRGPYIPVCRKMCSIKIEYSDCELNLNDSDEFGNDNIRLFLDAV